MKTKEELMQLKTEYEKFNNKLKELTEEELELILGGLSGEPEHLLERLGIGTAHIYCRECGFDLGVESSKKRASAKEYCSNCHKMVYVRR